MAAEVRLRYDQLSQIHASVFDRMCEFVKDAKAVKRADFSAGQPNDDRYNAFDGYDTRKPIGQELRSRAIELPASYGFPSKAGYSLVAEVSINGDLKEWTSAWFIYAWVPDKILAEYVAPEYRTGSQLPTKHIEELKGLFLSMPSLGEEVQENGIILETYESTFSVKLDPNSQELIEGGGLLDLIQDAIGCNGHGIMEFDERLQEVTDIVGGLQSSADLVEQVARIHTNPGYGDNDVFSKTAFYTFAQSPLYRH